MTRPVRASSKSRSAEVADPDIGVTDQVTAPFLSIVIPAYNEEQRLASTLGEVLDLIDSRPYVSEVIVVDDGSTDQTASSAEEIASQNAQLEVVRVPHRGKGWACRQGVLRSRGHWVLLCDADLSVPIATIVDIEPLLRTGNDIVIASREIAGARRVGEPLLRHVIGRGFNWIVRALAVPGIRDSQCGFKCFRREVANELFPRGAIDGWGFDVELLYSARRRGYRIHEVGVTWYYREGSKISPLRDAVLMLGDVLQIRLRGWRGDYTPS